MHIHQQFVHIATLEQVFLGKLKEEDVKLLNPIFLRSSVWSVEKLKNKLYGMRDLYQQTVLSSGSQVRISLS